MKKYFLSALLLIFCSTSMFFSCQNDETEMEPQSKIELLKAKSHEFAKKYGVDVTLNEDYLAKHADDMTVEGMEEDYKAFAELKNNAQHKDTVLTRKKTLSKKSFFARRKVETETMTPDMLDNEGEISSEGTTSKICCGSRITYKITVLWESVKGTIRVRLNNVSMFCNSRDCHKDERHNCSECKGSYSDNFWSNVLSGTITREGASFSTTCVIKSISVCAYTLKNVSVDVSCSGNHGRINLNL